MYARPSSEFQSRLTSVFCPTPLTFFISDTSHFIEPEYLSTHAISELPFVYLLGKTISDRQVKLI